MRKENRKKKILFVINSLQIGGAERQMLYILKYLNRDLFKPHLIIFREIGKEKELLPEDVEYTLCPLSGGPLKLIYGLLLFFYRAATLRPAFILSYMWRTNILSIAIGRVLFIRVIISERVRTVESTGEEVCGFIWRRLIRLFYPLSFKIIPVSTDVARGLKEDLKIPESKMRIIFNGVDTSMIEKKSRGKSPLEEPYILSSGRLVYQKNYELLIDAMEGVRSHSLVILGDGPLREQLILRARKKRVKLLLPGHIENPFIWMRYSETFVLSSRYEGFPNAVLEAMAAGAAVACTPFPGGINDIINSKNGIITTSRDPEDLRDAILSLTGDPEIREKIISASLKRIKDFDIRKIIKDYEKILSA